MAPRRGTRLIEHPFAILCSPITMKEQGPHRKHRLGVAAIVLNFQDDRPENSPKQPENGHFLDTKSAVERAKRLETQRNLFVVMRLGSPVVLSYLDAGFEPRCGRKDFWGACCLLLLAAAAACCC